VAGDHRRLAHFCAPAETGVTELSWGMAMQNNTPLYALVSPACILLLSHSVSLTPASQKLRIVP
jgi:hypothetical protein